MDDTITTIYYLCDELLKATGHCDDLQVKLSSAEVMTIPLVASTTFFCGNIEASRSVLEEHGYIPKAISKSRFNRRLHAIESDLWKTLFDLLAEAFKQNNPDQSYVVDSLPVAVCDNIRIHRCRLYPPKESAGAFRGYVSSKRRYFYGLRVHLVVRAQRASLLSSLWRRVLKLTLRCSRSWSWTYLKARSSLPTRAIPITITKTC